MIELFGEFLGTFILILLGNGVVANVNLDKTHSKGGGWIVITAGWGMAVFVAVLATANFRCYVRINICLPVFQKTF